MDTEPTPGRTNQDLLKLANAYVRRGPVYYKRSLPEYLKNTHQGKRTKVKQTVQ